MESLNFCVIPQKPIWNLGKWGINTKNQYGILEKCEKDTKNHNCFVIFSVPKCLPGNLCTKPILKIDFGAQQSGNSGKNTPISKLILVRLFSLQKNKQLKMCPPYPFIHCYLHKTRLCWIVIS